MGVAKQLFGALTFLLMGLALAALVAPPLLDDLRHSDEQLMPAFDVRVSEASCRSFIYVVSFCTVTLTPTAARTDERVVLSVLLGPAGGEAVAPMRSVVDPRYVTTSFARKSLVNRSLAFLAALILIGIGFVYSLWPLIRRHRSAVS